MIKKSEMTLSCQTLLPIIKTDENFDYFTKDIHRHHFFSSLITSSDFSRVMSILQRLSLKKQPVSCIFHLRQHQKPSMLVLLNGTYHNHYLNITIYDIATLDETRLREITYHKLHFSDEYLLKENSSKEYKKLKKKTSNAIICMSKSGDCSHIIYLIKMRTKKLVGKFANLLFASKKSDFSLNFELTH